MNAGKIWWEQIGNSLRFLTEVTANLRDCHSAVLQVPGQLPWRQEFYRAVDFRRSAFGGDRGLRRLPWHQGAEPGDFILKELCDEPVRANYWPGMSCAEYLGSLEDIILNDYYVWITGIHRKADLAKWVEFVSRYEKAAREQWCAVFVLEYDGEPVEVAELKTIGYSVENYDCRVFCLETAAALRNTDVRSYQAELALCIGHDDPEFSAKLLERGTELLTNPDRSTRWVLENGRTGDGSPFAPMTEQEIDRAVRKATMVLLFPILEQYRCDFVEAHEAELGRHLPMTNQYGDKITEPSDLELVDISHIIKKSTCYSKSEAELIRLCWQVRNKVAHNKRVPYELAQKLLTNQWKIN